jgi:hypothetical protein
MQTYYAFFEPGLIFATVRHGNDGGVSEMEWEHGIRCYYTTETNELVLMGQLLDDGFELLNKEAWDNFISSLDEPSNVPSNKFVSTHYVRDKWDGQSTIY